jgi:hypothetical protein
MKKNPPQKVDGEIACVTRVGPDSFDITNLRKAEEDKKKSGLFNHGLTLVKGSPSGYAWSPAFI